MTSSGDKFILIPHDFTQQQIRYVIIDIVVIIIKKRMKYPIHHSYEWLTDREWLWISIQTQSLITSISIYSLKNVTKIKNLVENVRLTFVFAFNLIIWILSLYKLEYKRLI